jgi:hypothetical protein
VAFDATVFEAHLRSAREAHNLLATYDALWKAFNHYYESLYVPSDGNNVKEYLLIHRAVDRIPAANRADVLVAAATTGIVDIPSVFDERMWNRFGEQMRGKHEKVKRLLSRSATGAPASSEDVKQVADLLYAIRCNATHGYKTPDGPRDVEVLSAAIPILEKLVNALPVSIELDDVGVA